MRLSVSRLPTLRLVEKQRTPYDRPLRRGNQLPKRPGLDRAL